MNEIDRREALKILGLGLVTVGAGSVVLFRHGQSRRNDEQAAGTSTGEAARTRIGVEQEPAPGRLIAPFENGSTIGVCRIAAMTGVVHGVVNLSLERQDGERFDVYICRRDDSPTAPAPVARTDYYDFFLPNGGKGGKPTNEENGRVVLALALLVQRNEKEQALLPLQTLQQYWRRS